MPRPLWLPLAWLLGCPGSPEDSDTSAVVDTDTDEDSDTLDTDVVDTDTGDTDVIDSGDTDPPDPTACDNGIDDDGDGLVDWAYDLGCFGPEDADEGSANRVLQGGWTVLEPADDTRIFYVSASLGDDAWSGLSPEPTGSDGPLRTVAAAKAKMVDGRPDWLLFRRGDVFVDQPIGHWSVSGRDEAAPVVLGSYGPSIERPRFEVRSDFMLVGSSGGASPNRSHVVLTGLHVVMVSKDPDDPRWNATGGSCLQWLRDGGDVLFEDMRCDYAQLSLQSDPTLPFTVRRSVFFGNYSVGSHAQGTFTSIRAPLTFEENVFVHGGWNEDFRLALTAPSADAAAWAAVSDGQFAVTLDGVAYNVDGIDFTGVTTLDEVATRLTAAITAAAPDAGVEVRWTAEGHALQLRSTLPSSDAYAIAAYSGSSAGTSLLTLLNSASQGAPGSTVFNRNMYLSHGWGNTVVRGNIDARGASGGVQERMGGVVEGNLFVEDPIAITVGHAENDGGYDVGGAIRDNVILGGADISTQVQGSGIWITSAATVTDGGTSHIRGLEISGNLIAHQNHGTGNIAAFRIGGNAPVYDTVVRDNIVYDWSRPVWPNPMDQRAYGFMYSTVDGSSLEVHHNTVVQPNGGFIAYATNNGVGLDLHDNTAWSAAPNPPDIWSRGWFQLSSAVPTDTWTATTGETGLVTTSPTLLDPTRDVAAYMGSLGRAATTDAFLDAAVAQSRYAWDPAITASAANEWVRAGYFGSP